MEEAKTMKTPMSSSIKLDMDEKGKSVNSTMYRGMIGSLLYLTASRPNIMYSCRPPPFGCYFMQLILAACHSRISQYRIKIVELMDQLGEDTYKGEEGSRRRICRPLS